MTIEVGMPVYRPSARLETVLTALALQTYKDFYINIYNNTSPSDTEEIKKDEDIVCKMRKEYNLNINLIQNEINLGYMANMHKIIDKATGDILLLLADDDILSYDCIEQLAQIFKDPEVGCVSRPYYWFIDDFRKAVRFKGIINGKNRKISILDSSLEDVKNCISAADQLSGLAFRTRVLKNGDMPFVEDMFTVHVYPFLYAFKNSSCVYMGHPTVAVSISTSQCQNDIYSPSPIEQWINLYNNVLYENKFIKRKKELIEAQITTDFTGLAQIKNYGTFRELFREIMNYIKYRKMNLINLKFYIFSIGSLIIPRFILKRMINWYKKRILATSISKLDIDYNLFPFDKIKGFSDNTHNNKI